MRLIALALALLLVLAGCSAPSAVDTATDPTASPAETTTATPSTESVTSTPTAATPETERSAATDSATATPTGVAVRGGDYPANASLVVQRVQRLVGTSVAPPTVYLKASDRAALFSAPPTRFMQALGFERPDGARVGAVAYTVPRTANVYVFQAALTDRTRAERVLAHESVHVVQFRKGWATDVATAQLRLDGERTFDGLTTYYLVLEGSAVYVTDRYQRRYMPDATPALTVNARRYENASSYARLGYARYHFGGRYVAAVIDSPAAIERLHESPPISSEQVLHRTDDPIANLSVTAAGVEDWRLVDRNRMGELFVRIALRGELNRSAAAAGAAGWGDDRKLTFANGSRRGHAWVLTWDDPSNATEFERTVRAFVAERASERGDIWVADDGGVAYRVERVSDRTVVVFAGNRSFVESATAAAPGEDRVRVEN